MSVGWKLYKIKAGDSLSGIALRECRDVRLWPLIAETNGITDTNRIYPGNSLLIPDRSLISQAKQAQKSTSSRRQSVPSVKFDNYPFDFGSPAESVDPMFLRQDHQPVGGLSGAGMCRKPLGTPAVVPDAKKTPTAIGGQQAPVFGHPILEYLIGGGYEEKQYQTNIGSAAGPGWKVEINVSATLRFGRSGKLASVWTNGEDFLKYRAELLKYGKDEVVALFQGINIKLKPTSSGPPSLEVVFGAKMGNEVRQSSLGANSAGQLIFRYEHVHVDKFKEGEYRIATECKVTIDPSAVVAATIVSVAVSLSAAFKNAIDDLAQIHWDKALDGLATITAVAGASLLWYRAIVALRAAAAVAAAFAEGATAVIPVILIPNEDLWRLLHNHNVLPQA